MKVSSSQFLPVALSLWIFWSVVSTIVNKRIMKEFPFPNTLALLHLISGTIVDAIIVYRRESQLRVSMSLIAAVFPVAITLGLGKILTFLSYGTIPLSLAHTVKSSAPIFSVFISRVFLNENVSSGMILSLIPICVGVTISAVTEVNFEIIGFLAVLTATFLGVLQNSFTKNVLNKDSTSDVMVVHFHTALTAMLIMAPLTVYTDLPRIRLHEISIPFWNLALSITSQYVQTILSTFILSSVTVVTHQVSSTFKRLIIIMSSVAYFGNEVTAMNFLGMVVGVLGFGMFSRARSLAKKSISAAEDKTVYDDLELEKLVAPESTGKKVVVRVKSVDKKK